MGFCSGGCTWKVGQKAGGCSPPRGLPRGCLLSRSSGPDAPRPCRMTLEARGCWSTSGAPSTKPAWCVLSPAPAASTPTLTSWVRGGEHPRDPAGASPSFGGFGRLLGHQRVPRLGFLLPRGCLFAEDKGWEEPGDLRPLQHRQVGGSAPAPALGDTQPWPAHCHRWDLISRRCLLPATSFGALLSASTAWPTSARSSTGPSHTARAPSTSGQPTRAACPTPAQAW